MAWSLEIPEIGIYLTADVGTDLWDQYQSYISYLYDEYLVPADQLDEGAQALKRVLERRLSDGDYIDHSR